MISLTPWVVGQPVLEGLLWKPGQDVAAVIERLERQIESANLTPALVFDPTVLVERINEEWALTEEGLESLNSDVFLSIKEFLSQVVYIAAYISGKSPEFDPPPPPGVDAETWSLPVEIAMSTFRIGDAFDAHLGLSRPRALGLGADG